MATRKNQIENFKKIHRILRDNGTDGGLKATREEFLAYGLVRGRPYKHLEETIRSYKEKSGPNDFEVLKAINAFFPVPTPVPVPVGPDGMEIPLKPWEDPWPEIDYTDLLKTVRTWLSTPMSGEEKALRDAKKDLRVERQVLFNALNVWPEARCDLEKAGWKTLIEFDPDVNIADAFAEKGGHATLALRILEPEDVLGVWTKLKSMVLGSDQ